MKPHISLKVEYILLIIAALSFAVTELCRQNANKKFSALDECFARVESAAYAQGNASLPRSLRT
mgnify:FL=1